MGTPQVHWLLENDTFDEGNPEKMEQIAKARGSIVHRIKYVPFGGDLGLPYLPKDACVLAYGSINLLRTLAKVLWVPTTWFNSHNFLCSTYYSNWNQYILQKFAMTTWADLNFRRDFWYKLLGGEDTLFIRPNSSMKTFTGKAVEFKEFNRWHAQESECYEVDPESLVVCAAPRNIEAEWRIVIVNGEVVAHSQYRSNGKTDVDSLCDSEAIDLAKTLAKDLWQPAKAYVLDVCRVGNGNPVYHVLEIGCVNCAGLYACNLEKVVEAMETQAREDWIEIFG